MPAHLRRVIAVVARMWGTRMVAVDEMRNAIHSARDASLVGIMAGTGMALTPSPLLSNRAMVTHTQFGL